MIPVRRLSPPLPAHLIWHLEPGLHADGANLYLRVTETLGRSWVFIIYLAGRRREFGLGGARKVSLGEARAKAEAVRSRLIAGAA